MKRFRTVEEMNAVPKIRRPDAVHTMDQIVGQAARNGWTVGVSAENLVGAQCGTVVGLHEADDKWLSGDRMTGVWYKTQEDAAAHQAAMDRRATAPMPASPLAPWPAAAWIRRTSASLCHPGADDSVHQRPAVDRLQKARMGLRGGIVLRRLLGPGSGQGRAQPVHSLLRRAALRRRHGGRAPHGHSPRYLPGVLDGLAALSSNGLRYPIAPYGVNNDARAGMGVSYG